MATETQSSEQPAGGAWYSLGPEAITARLGVDPAVGLSSQRGPELLVQNGPNALPAEQAVPTWKRFVGQYRSYMQMILVGAAIVSLAIQEWSTGVLLIVITMVNATARVRRDGSEAEIAAEEVVVGDVVLLAAGDEVSADGRIVEASALQIDESGLTGESVLASKGSITCSTVGIASGIAAIASAIALVNTSVADWSRCAPRMNMITIVIPAAAAIQRVSVFSCLVSGVCSRAVLASLPAIFPTAVSLPVAVTIITALPLRAGQFGLALAAAVLLLALWEVGKLIARRRSSTGWTGSSLATAAELTAEA